MSERKDLALAIGAGFAAGVIGAGLVSAFLGRARGKGKRVAVVLSGCGVYDGSEITEAVAVLVAASKHGAVATCFAPAMAQRHVVDHSTGDLILAPPLAHRDARAEAARIARGDVRDIATLSASDFDCLVFPGGFGVAKNLSNFGTAGPSCVVLDDAARAIRAFHQAGKPIGFTCIAPVLAARVIKGVTVTLGRSEGADDAEWPYRGVAGAAAAMGADVVEADVDAVVVDKANKVVTTPAYMKKASPDLVFDGVSKCVATVLAMA
eukprot:CAMPEP_0203814970 /NCGR_PEP_ID=MMETSP0115-20131106/7115_1 /ASSEMBLY_ACC=CAM_ASM_000227 /TAXON_ID=33651 /ORGANISM="Bicosoecid sp, Strain ms1" /LENGTH=264 /DNA_ID=CAMNT_0050723857 /DNA_START=9 /DNA_END=803 /DNA_ORIENTATION=+